MGNTNAKERPIIFRVHLNVSLYFCPNSFDLNFVVGPDIAPFSFTPAPEYTCYYAVGKFLPDTIPQCVYGNF